MTGVDAAYKVLSDADEPLHYREITKRMIQRRLWRTSGRTPEQTINRDISEEINNRGENSRFSRVGRGMYAAASPAVLALKQIMGDTCGMALRGSIVERRSPGFRSRVVIEVRAGLACVIGGWRSLSRESQQQILQIVRTETLE